MSAVPYETRGDESALARHAREVAALASQLAEHHGLTGRDMVAIAALHDLGKAPAEDPHAERDVSPSGTTSNVRPLGKARKVSVSMPEDLTAAVQERVGRGEFSQYVTDAVARQLQLDLMAELSDLLEEDHGPVPEEFIAEAKAAWPDVQ